MVLDKGVAAVELLEFGQETGGDVAGTLEIPQQIADALLPVLNVGPIGGGLNHIGGSKARIVLDQLDNVHGFGHDEIVFWEGLKSKWWWWNRVMERDVKVSLTQRENH